MLDRALNVYRTIAAAGLRRRLLASAGWSGLATVGSRGLAVAATFLLARILGPVGFGEYGMLVSTIGLVAGLSGAGMGLTVTRHIAELRGTDPERAGRVIALAYWVSGVSMLTYGLVIVLGSSWLASHVIAAPHLAQPLSLCVLPFISATLFSLQMATLDGFEAFRQKALVSVLAGIAQTVGVVVGAGAGGLLGALVGMTLVGLLIGALVQGFLHRQWSALGIRLDFGHAWQERGILFGFGVPTLLIQLIGGPTYWAVNAMLANQPEGYVQVGILSAGMQWQGAVATLASVVTAGMVPVLTQTIATKGIEAGARIMRKMMGLLGLAVPGVTLALALASPLIARGYGEAYVSEAWTLVALLLAGALSAVMLPLIQFITACGKMWGSVVIHLGWSVFILGASAALRDYGAWGMALARLFAQAVLLAMLALLVARVRSRASICHPS